jgi:hypothetical protein
VGSKKNSEAKIGMVVIRREAKQARYVGVRETLSQDIKFY